MDLAFNPTAFRPTDSWRWYFDPQYDCLMLDLGHDMLFRSRFSKKMLVPDVFDTFPFTVNDAALYYQFHDSCLRLNLTESQRIELTINAIIAANFLKPQLPKSWYFQSHSELLVPKLADVVVACMQSGELINLLVIEVGTTASLCLVADPSLVAMNKTFHFAEVIKVMNDRLVERSSVIEEPVSLSAIS